MRLALDGDVWDIVQDGAKLVITAGGKQSTRKFISPDHAQLQMKKLVAEKVAAGWVESNAPLAIKSLEPREPALEQQVLDALDDPAPYAVMADWYQAQQHPRGELIALQLADRDAKKIDTAIAKLLARHKDLLLGPLVEYDAPVDSPFEWRNGFIYGLTVDDPALAKAVTAHPSGRFLGRVTIHSDSARTIAKILAAVNPATLRELVIRTSSEMPALDLVAAAPRLRELECVTIAGFASLTGVAKVASTLERLYLRGSMEWEELAPLFARTDLAIRDFGYCDESISRVLPALATSTLAGTVERLDFAHCDPGWGLRGLINTAIASRG
ncbi:MAG: hypothetical protein QM831_25920 [Kofleriaceae bacterium]